MESVAVRGELNALGDMPQYNSANAPSTTELMEITNNSDCRGSFWPIGSANKAQIRTRHAISPPIQKIPSRMFDSPVVPRERFIVHMGIPKLNTK
jgi:hypothetical protein